MCFGAKAALELSRRNSADAIRNNLLKKRLQPASVRVEDSDQYALFAQEPLRSEIRIGTVVLVRCRFKLGNVLQGITMIDLSLIHI